MFISTCYSIYLYIFLFACLTQLFQLILACGSSPRRTWSLCEAQAAVPLTCTSPWPPQPDSTFSLIALQYPCLQRSSASASPPKPVIEYSNANVCCSRRFKLLGTMMAKALLDGRAFPIRISYALARCICGEVLDFDDLSSIMNPHFFAVRLTPSRMRNVSPTHVQALKQIRTSGSGWDDLVFAWPTNMSNKAASFHASFTWFKAAMRSKSLQRTHLSICVQSSACILVKASYCKCEH